MQSLDQKNNLPDKINEEEKSLNTEIKEIFSWFKINENFLNDVGKILKKYEEKGTSSLSELKQNYLNRLKNTRHKKHFQSLLTIIDFISKPNKNNINFIKTLNDLANSYLDKYKLKQEIEKKEKNISDINEKLNETNKRENELNETKKRLQILVSAKNRIKSIEEGLNGIIKSRDNNEGYFNTIIDGVRGVAGLETGRKIYTDIFEKTKTPLENIKGELNKLKNQIGTTKEEKDKADELIKEITRVNRIALGHVGTIDSIINTAKASPRAFFIDGFVYGGSGVVLGTIEGGVNLIKSTLDLTAFILKYSGSLIGINSEYKNEINKQAGLIWDYLDKNGLSGFGNEVYKVIGNELDKISKLPRKEQSIAIGKLAGNVIFIIGAIKGTMMLTQKTAQLSKNAARASSLFEKINLKGMSNRERAKKVALIFAEAKNAKNLSLTLETFLNGPAETLIGASLTKASLSVYQKLKNKNATDIEFSELADIIAKQVENPSANIKSKFEGHALENWFYKYGKKRHPEEVNFLLKSWDENINFFPKEIHSKLSVNPNYLNDLINIGKENKNALNDIINILKRKNFNNTRDLIDFVLSNLNRYDDYGGVSIFEKNGRIFLGMKKQEGKYYDEIVKDNTSKTDNEDDILKIPIHSVGEWKDTIKEALKGDQGSIGLTKMYPYIGVKMKILKKYNLKGLNSKELDEIIEMIADDRISKDKFQKIIGKKLSIDGYNSTPYEYVKNPNEGGPTTLNNINLEMLENITSVPRTIEINGSIASIMKSSTTKDGKKIYTIRYGLSLGNVQRSPMQGVSKIIIDKNKLYYGDINTSFTDGRFDDIRNKIIEQIGKGKEKISGLNLDEIKKGKTASIIGVVKKSKTEIFDGGINAEGEKVLVINLKDNNGKSAGEFEMHLYEDEGKNVIYIGAMAKNGSEKEISKGLESLIPRLRDILKQFPNKKMPEIRYIRTANDGGEGKYVKIGLDTAISKWFKNNPKLVSIADGIINLYYKK